MSLIDFLFLALATASIALTITKAVIFEPMRDWIGDRSDFFGELFSCPYCMSHWVSFGFIAYYQPRLVSSQYLIADLFTSAFALITLSSLFAALVFRLFGGSEEE